jgi:hypothetical protein
MKAEEIKNKTNEAVAYLVEALQSGQSEVLSEYLTAMARFHNYSFGNIMLIARQKPTATRIAGIRTWNSLGRFVKRGENGILILAPMVGHRAQRREEIATEIERANAAEERKSIQELYGFRAVYVFDVEQTEGKELPSLTNVRGDVTGYRERLVEYVESQGIKLSYSEKIAPAKGLSSGKRITLLTGMQPAEEFSTLVHELAKFSTRLITSCSSRGVSVTTAGMTLSPRTRQASIRPCPQIRSYRVPSDSSARLDIVIGFLRPTAAMLATIS